jgi:uncharacterized protein YecE (DUF72 family)
MKLEGYLKRIVRVGTAGWTVPSAVKHAFPQEGSHLERYGGVLAAAEINSSFHRPHSAKLYAKWADAVPESFRFSVKLPKTITHERRLVRVKKLTETFIREISGLREKLGCLLVQLPPSFEFNGKVAAAFFMLLRSKSEVDIACEPRHATWFGAEAEDLLRGFEIARVAADPARVPDAAIPGGAETVCYYRLHGSPRMYYSQYSDQYISKLARAIKRASARRIWCMFDNTASGAAMPNALDLMKRLKLGS